MVYQYIVVILVVVKMVGYNWNMFIIKYRCDIELHCTVQMWSVHSANDLYGSPSLLTLT